MIMAHTMIWTSPLGLHTMDAQIINFYILMDFSLLLSVKNMESLGDDFWPGRTRCEAGLSTTTIARSERSHTEMA